MKNTKRLKYGSIAGIIVCALILANAQSIDMRARLAIALETIAVAFGGSVEAQSVDMDARAALAAEEIVDNLSGITGVSFTPTNYTASATNAEGHLIGVDVALGAIASSGVPDGDKGDVTVSSSGTVWTLDAVYQPTNAALTALAANANLYQATNAALTALAANPALYQATNATLTTVSTNTITGTGPLLGRDLLRLTGTINAVTNPVDWTMLLNVPAGIADGTDDGGSGSGTPTYVNGTEVTQGPDFDNTAASGTVTPTTFTVTASTNVTLTIGNASATQAGAVTTGTQSFAGAKTFTGDVTVEGTLILSGSGGGGMDSLNVTNKLTNSVLTATRVVFAGADKALADDADLTFATDTLNATKLTSTDVRAGLLVVTNAATVGSIAAVTNVTTAAGVFTNTLTLPQSDDPDVSAAGHLAWDTDGWLRAYDGAAQVAVGRKQEEIHATVIAPNDLADAVRDACLIWSNESGMSFIVTGWKAWSGTDNTTLNIETTAADGSSNATVDAVEIATDGTGVFTGADTSITAGTIANGSLIWLDFDDTDTPTYVKITLYGYYAADVN